MASDSTLDAELLKLVHKAAREDYWVYYIGENQDHIKHPPPKVITLVAQGPVEASVLVVWKLTDAVAFTTREGAFESALKCDYVTWDSGQRGDAWDAFHRLDTTTTGGRPYSRPAWCEIPELSTWPAHWQRTWAQR